MALASLGCLVGTDVPLLNAVELLLGTQPDVGLLRPPSIARGSASSLERS
jgi:hypothetical protein